MCHQQSANVPAAKEMYKKDRVNAPAAESKCASSKGNVLTAAEQMYQQKKSNLPAAAEQMY